MIEKTKIAVSHDGGVATVSGSGEMDLYIAAEFGRALEDAVASSASVVVDFRSVSYLDSAIVACLIKPAKALHLVGERLKVLVAPNSYPHHMLKTLGFTEVMDIVVEDNSV
ncbi:MAG: STAS domain-containing protein [Armatimonadota bacterium]|nr:STAS domain-containing protein [Armatimonadota bacterium]